MNRMMKQAPQLCAALVVGVSQAANAQQVAPSVESLTTVVVTGTRGKPRTVTSSSAPIDVISSTALSQLSGAGDLRDSLAQVLPSFQTQEWVGSSSWNSVMRPAGLRGLGGADVLVLVDGKRRHNSAMLDLSSGNLDNGANPVDLDLIPNAAIDHIEVLRDGASAQYGSDAIAGVINIILKKNDHGKYLSADAGRRYKGDGANYGVDGSVSIPLPHEGSTTLALSVDGQERATRAEPATGAFYFPLNGAPDPREATVDRYTYKGGLPKSNQVLLSENSQMVFGDTALYNTGTFGYRNAWVGQAGRRPNSTSDVDSVYPNGFTPFYTLREFDFQDTMGVKGILSTWNWDLSTTYGSNYALSGAIDSLNASLGPASPTRFDTFSSTFDQATTNLDFTKQLSLGGKPLDTSFGIEHRYEYYNTRARDPAAYEDGGYIYPSGPLAGQHAAVGAQGAILVTPGDQANLSRNNLAAYAELDYNPTKAWYVGVAGRVEHYDDSSGTTSVGKFSTRYALTRSVALRATVSSGFRAPSLPQEGFSDSGSQYKLVSTGYELIQSTLAPVISPLARALGAKPLKPETSTNYSTGLVLTPMSGVSATIDAYEIDLKHRVALTGLLAGAGVNAVEAANGLPINQQVQYFANAIDTRTRGLDLVATSQHRFDHLGAFNLSVGYNYNKTDITNIAANPAQLSGLGLTLFDRAAQGAVTLANPHSKVILDEDWTSGRWGLNLRQTRYGSFTTLNDTPTLDQTYGAKWLTDISVSREFGDYVTVSIGADNALNVYPDKSKATNTIGLAPYGNSPFGYYGGYYYIRLTYSD